MERHLEASADMDNLRQFCDFVVAAAREAGLPDADVYHCELAVDEACCNIIEHGAVASEVDEAFLHVAVQIEPHDLVITISDNCPPFNPLNFDTNDALQERLEPGGWGIHFLKSLMDDIDYTYQDGQNHLTLHKRY